MNRGARRLVAGCGGLVTAVALAGCALLSPGFTPLTVMSVSSAAFARGTIMPASFTCGGPRTLSPPLDWSGEPKGTQSIALVLDDADAPITPYVYWIVFDIEPGTSATQEGLLPPGAKQALGSAGYDRYDAPCPGPQGHDYRFTVYALNRVLDLPNGTSLMSAWRAIAAATIGRGRLAVSATS